MITIDLENIVVNASSNEEGEKLFDVILNHYNKGDEITIKLNQDSSLSSSFLNSSVGAFLESFGVQNFRNRIKIIGTKSQFERIREYIDRYSNLYL